MTSCIFVSDLHGHHDRFQKLFNFILEKQPAALFLGGDLLPHDHYSHRSMDPCHKDFIHHYLVPEFNRLRDQLQSAYPRVFLILGNDDSRFQEAAVLAAAASGVWEYLHMRQSNFLHYRVFGYACVPPTPFTFKDWEKYDVSRYVDPGCVSPEEGRRSIPVSAHEAQFGTIKEDLEKLTEGYRLENSIFLFHAPPYQSGLDRAALDGIMVEHVPRDVHVGSVAIRRFIEEKQPMITLHGHIHESSRLTGFWQEQFGATFSFSAAHDGPELAVVEFDPEHPAATTRTLI